MIAPTLISELDDRVRLYLEAMRNDWFHCLMYTTAAVVVGVFLELPEAVKSIRRKLRFDFHMHPSVHQEGGTWEERVAFVGLLILIVGLCGEMVFEYLVFDADGALQAFGDSMVAVTRKAAADANERAAKASLETERLRKEAGARRLTGIQKETLRRILAPHPTPLAVMSCLFDQEGSDFADDFSAALTAAGWRNVRNSTLTDCLYGVRIGIEQGGLDTPQVKRLKGALSAVGVESQVIPLTVGSRSATIPVEARVLYLRIEKHPPLKE